MTSKVTKKQNALLKCGYVSAVAIALLSTTGVQAQTQADTNDDKDNVSETIIVTGSRINKAGFDQPTPTTVIGSDELLQGDRSSIQQVLNDQPQFRPTVTPTVSVGNTSRPAALRQHGDPVPSPGW